MQTDIDMDTDMGVKSVYRGLRPSRSVNQQVFQASKVTASARATRIILHVGQVQHIRSSEDASILLNIYEAVLIAKNFS